MLRSMRYLCMIGLFSIVSLQASQTPSMGAQFVGVALNSTPQTDEKTNSEKPALKPITLSALRGTPQSSGAGAALSAVVSSAPQLTAADLPLLFNYPNFVMIYGEQNLRNVIAEHARIEAAKRAQKEQLRVDEERLNELDHSK